LSGRRSISSRHPVSLPSHLSTSRLAAVAVRKLIGGHLPATPGRRDAGGLIAGVEGGSRENKTEGDDGGVFGAE